MEHGVFGGVRYNWQKYKLWNTLDWSKGAFTKQLKTNKISKFINEQKTE